MNIQSFPQKLLSLFLRFKVATSYYNKKYIQILKWLFISREHTNFTYKLTEGNIIALTQLISIITDKKFADVYKYINEPENDTELNSFIINKTKNSKLKWKADLRSDFGKRLGWYAIVRIRKPQIVVETGIDKGLGGVLICAALLKNMSEGFPGKYYGTDINSEAGYLIDGKYKEVAELLIGDSIESLKKLDKLIDVFINDSDHSAEYEYQEYLTIQQKINENTIIIGDNSHATDKLSEFSLNNNRDFLFFQEKPLDHWYPGGGIGFSFKRRINI